LKALPPGSTVKKSLIWMPRGGKEWNFGVPSKANGLSFAIKQGKRGEGPEFIVKGNQEDFQREAKRAGRI